MAEELGIKPVHLSGHLHALWHAALEQFEDGDLSQTSDRLKTDLAQYDGDAEQFISLLRKHGFLDGDLLHDWLDYAGRYLITKYRTASPRKLKEIFSKHSRTLDGLKTVSRRTHTSTSTSTKRELKFSPTARRLAEVLDARIRRNNPDAIVAANDYLNQWAADIDKLNRIDGRTWEMIERVLEFSQRDSFWRSNVLSGAKLRKQWNQLAAKMQTRGPEPGDGFVG